MLLTGKSLNMGNLRILIFFIYWENNVMRTIVLMKYRYKLILKSNKAIKTTLLTL